MVVRTSSGLEITGLPGVKIYPGPKRDPRRVVIVQDSQFVGHGSFAGIGLDLIMDLGLVSQTISTVIRLWKMGFVSRNYLLQFPRVRASRWAIYWSIRL